MNMDGEGQVLEGQEGADEDALESEAAELGWKPEGEWRGDKSKWVDARTFMDKVGIILPVLRQKNQEMHQTITSLRAQDRARAAELAAVQEALESVQKVQQEDGAARAEQLAEDIEADIERASEAGDHKRLAKLTSDLAELKAAQLIKKEKEAAGGERRGQGVAAQPQADPSFLAWIKDNPWYGQDKKRSRLAVIAAQNTTDDSPGLTGADFFSKVDEELARLEGRAAPRRQGSRVAAGGSSGGDSGGSEGGDTSYASLPAEAKAACERQAKYLVGANKAHKDLASWRKAYTKTYRAQEQR